MLEFQFRSLKIGVRFSFFAVLLLMTELCRSDWGLWCAAACMLHELGHFFACAAVGQKPRALYFEAGGIRMVPPSRPLSAGQEAFVPLAGSGANFLTGSLLWLTGRYEAAGFHFFLGIFNLLPLSPLDGGMLLALLLERFFSLRAAGIAGKIVHWLLWAALTAAGWYLFRQSGNFTLLFTLFCLAFPAK